MQNIAADTKKIVHVAVAAIVNHNNEVLIARRPQAAHQGGLWEFPGGKVETGESVLQALTREVLEEINLQVLEASPLIQIKHAYTDKTVFLDVWLVTRYAGDPKGLEGQPLKWQNILQLKTSEFPEANMSIIKALQLPAHYMITGGFNSADEFENRLKTALDKGPKIVQLRCKQVDNDIEYLQIAKLAQAVCDQYAALLLLNTSPAVFKQSQAAGLHLNSQRLFEYEQRPVAADKLLSVSCHSQEEMQQAERLGADILLLSPVKETASHPGVPGIGWQTFQQWVEAIKCPVYALGGMQASDLDDARQAGAQGVAAISSFWSNK